ncbi:hypothetical protein A6D6_03421, partial [Alcanivorax xiamenensis]
MIPSVEDSSMTVRKANRIKAITPALRHGMRKLFGTATKHFHIFSRLQEDILRHTSDILRSVFVMVVTLSKRRLPNQITKPPWKLACKRIANG